jgi:exodeoxyribonuclease VII small subunit
MSGTNKTIQQKMDELSELIAWFDSDDFALEEAIDKFKVAEQLSSEIEKDLSSFKNNITVLKQKFDSEA